MCKVLFLAVPVSPWLFHSCPWILGFAPGCTCFILLVSLAVPVLSLLCSNLAPGRYCLLFAALLRFFFLLMIDSFLRSQAFVVSAAVGNRKGYNF